MKTTEKHPEIREKATAPKQPVESKSTPQSKTKRKEPAKTKTVKYKTNAKGKDNVNKIKPQLDSMDFIEVWTIDPDDPEGTLTIVMDKKGDVTVIETVVTSAGFFLQPCACDE